METPMGVHEKVKQCTSPGSMTSPDEEDNPLSENVALASSGLCKGGCWYAVP